jgi:hypothetical protein
MRSKKLVCPKGHKKLKASVMLDDDDQYTWIYVECATCNETLFYNGA